MDKKSTKEAFSLLNIICTTPQIAVPLLRGTPGLGKSQLVEQLARAKAQAKTQAGCKGCKDKVGNPAAHEASCPAHHEVGQCVLCAQGESAPHVELRDVRLSTFDPIETKGLPYVDNTNNSSGEKLTQWATPAWFPTADTHCILFLDEFLNAPAATQNAALQLIYDRRIGATTLGKNVVIIAAGNTVEDGSYVTRLGGAAKNRLAFIDIAVDGKAWCEWAAGQEDIPSVFVAAASWRPDTFLGEGQNFDREKDAQPTPRTYTRVAKLAHQQNLNPSQVRAVAETLIGRGAAVELGAYLDLAAKLDVDAMLETGELPAEAKDTKNVSLRYAISGSLTGRVRNMEQLLGKEALVRQVKNLFAILNQLGPELAIKTLAHAELSKRPRLVAVFLKHSPEFKRLMKHLIDAVTE